MTSLSVQPPVPFGTAFSGIASFDGSGWSAAVSHSFGVDNWGWGGIYDDDLAQAAVIVQMYAADGSGTSSAAFGDVTVSYRVLDQLFLTGAAGYHIFSRELKGNIVDGKFTTIPIVGCQNQAQLEDSLSAAGVRLTPEQLAAIHVKTPLEGFLVATLRAGRDVVLTGNPGDGKTHLIMQLLPSLDAIGVKHDPDASAAESTTSAVSE